LALNEFIVRSWCGTGGHGLIFRKEKKIEKVSGKKIIFAGF